MRRKRNPAEDLYHDFHDADPREIYDVEIDLPDEFMTLGEVEVVTYRPPKYSKRYASNTVYEHQFGDNGFIVLPDRPLLAYSPDLPGVLLIVGSDFIVDGRGIVG